MVALTAWSDSSSASAILKFIINRLFCLCTCPQYFLTNVDASRSQYEVMNHNPTAEASKWRLELGKKYINNEGIRLLSDAIETRSSYQPGIYALRYEGGKWQVSEKETLNVNVVKCYTIRQRALSVHTDSSTETVMFLLKINETVLPCQDLQAFPNSDWSLK